MMPLGSTCLCYDPEFEQSAYQVSVTISVCTSDVTTWIGFHCLILTHSTYIGFYSFSTTLITLYTRHSLHFFVVSSEEYIIIILCIFI
jgi:hypothetical protein